MKRFSKILCFFLLVFSISFVSAQDFYTQQWKKIETNTKKGGYKSNLSMILEIQNVAMKENNVLEIIKSLKAEFSILRDINDDEKNDETSQFFTKIREIEEKLKGDQKIVFQVFSAEFLPEYFDDNSWEISRRTNINQQDLAQIETWSALDFKKYITNNYSALQSQEKVMQKISLNQYKTIFSNDGSFEFFPTLYDWFLYTKIDFLQNTELFTKNELQSNYIEINSLYDQLIANNTGNAKLYFMKQKIDDNCDFTNCKDQLQQLQSLLKTNVEGDYKAKIAVDVMYELMILNKNKEALEIAKTIKQKYPNSSFLEDVKNREIQILNSVVNFQFEENVMPNQPIQIVVDYKNSSKLTLNIYEIKEDLVSFLQYKNYAYNDNFKKLKKSLVRTENYVLKDFNDYVFHKTAFEIQPLPSGIYVVEYLVNDKKAAENENQNFYFVASNSKIIYKNKATSKQNENLFLLVNSENGKKIKNQNLSFYEVSDKNTLISNSGKTDSQGVFIFPQSASKSYAKRFIVKQPQTNDYNFVTLYNNDFINDDDPNSKYRSSAQIFLDRAIYRPGQIVYFKVINTQIINDKQSVISGQKQKIILLDANNKEVASQDFTTNTFGSYHGSFVLPKGKLNGNFRLRTEGGAEGYKSFKVEEYKRPNFEVTFDPIKDEYKYGENIQLKGKAQMYSGVALSNVVVKYSIQKQNIRWRYFPWYESDYEQENSILGETKTNDKGEFVIDLNLKENPNLEGIQIDNYEIQASVTDINGETQNAFTNVKVASVSHYITAESINKISSGEAIKIKVETKNYNDQNVNKPYQAKLSKLITPHRVFRQNFNTAIQNSPVYTKEEFYKKFPHDCYDKNDTLENLKIEKIIFEKTQQASPDLDLGKLEAGEYFLELYNVEGKDTIKATQYFSVWDKTKLENNKKSFLSVLAPKKEFSRGETAHILVYSAIPNAIVNVFVQDGLGTTVYEEKEIKNGVLEYHILLPKDSKVTRLNLQFQIVAYNDVQTEIVQLNIKNQEQPLEIETLTFRDKIEPNSKEKWAIKVKGGNNEKVNAEVLANMYDMSLDRFVKNKYSWVGLYQNYSIVNNYNERSFLSERYYQNRLPFFKNKNIVVPAFNWFDGEIYSDKIVYEGVKTAAYAPPSPTPMRAAKVDSAPKDSVVAKLDEVVMVGYGQKKNNAGRIAEENLDTISVRENLNETAFFYPDLKTDSDGVVRFEFTSPEALTKWKLMFLANTQDARGAVLEKEVVTQKEFSVTPNYPRFLREGDELNLQTKLSNLTNKKLNGSAQLQILDAFTNEDISTQFGLSALTEISEYNKEQAFAVNENGNSVLTWKVKVPANISSIIIKVVAKAGNYSDGEQKAIAVLPNRILITEATPIFVKEGETKTFEIDNLKNSTSTTITNVSNTLELTTNPIWEIMFALPSLKNDNNNSADVIFNKWFADVLASEILKANPKLKTVFEEYQTKELLVSNLEKNQELKQLLLDETPWVLESQNEEDQMKKIALLFDANSMKNSIQQDWDEFQKLQNSDGGFSWYSGYPSSFGTSMYILKNLGKINSWLKNNVKEYQSESQDQLVENLVKYVDNEVEKYWDIKNKNVWNNWTLDYLDTRNYWETKYPLKGKGATIKSLVKQKAKNAKLSDFTFFGLHRSALLMNDYGLKDVSNKLMNYLKETSTESKNQGVYWKQNLNDWGWFRSKVVNHAGAIEAFSKLKPDDVNFIEELKVWLATQKEVNSWGSSRGTSEVIFTMLNSGKSWTSSDTEKVKIVWGGKGFEPQTQAAGFVKSAFKTDKIDKNFGVVTVSKLGPGIVQGGLYWQYYENLNAVNSSENYVSVTKEIYKKVTTENGEELQKITSDSPLKIGDRVTVRMILNTDRPMEFVHVKDMRAAGLEPIDVFSGYRWNNNLGYYQSTKDASTNFYIEYMPKGKYVFEYDFVANASGNFLNGITTIQNYYAPQMSSHTKGTMVAISEE